MRTRLVTLAAALALLVAAFLAHPPPTGGPALRDFESYYAAGATWLYHGDPYGREIWRVERTIPGVVATREELLPFVGPPFGLPLWSALARLDWHAATLLWGTILACSFGAIALGSLALARGRIGALDAAAVLVFAGGFGPLTSGVALGQVAVVSVAAIVLFPLLLRSRTAFAPAAAALIAALQPNLAIVLVARAGGRRTWIAFALALALAIGGSALALAASGGLARYLEVLRAHAASERFIAIQTTVSAVARGLGASAQASGLIALGIAVAAAAVLVLQLLSRRYAPNDRLALACAALPLALPFAHEHDFTIALYPIVALVRRARGAAWIAGTIAAVGAGVDWLGLAQRPSGTLEAVLLAAAAATACAALSGSPVRPFHFIPLVVPIVVAVVAVFARAHPLPTWPADLPATFHLPRSFGAADVWREEQIASGVAGLGPLWAFLRLLSLASCALVWLVASRAFLSSQARTRSEPSSTRLRPRAATRPSV